MSKNSGAIIVSWSFSHNPDEDILLVGNRIPSGRTVVINAFRGEEARELYSRLTTVKGEENNGRDL